MDTQQNKKDISDILKKFNDQLEQLKMSQKTLLNKITDKKLLQIGKKLNLH